MSNNRNNNMPEETKKMIVIELEQLFAKLPGVRRILLE
jgi:hypothetical protein